MRFKNFLPFKLSYQLLNPIVVIAVISGLFLMNCASSTGGGFDEENFVERYTGEAIEDGIIVGMVEIKKIDLGNQQDIGTPYPVYTGEEEEDEKIAADPFLIPGQMVVHIIKTGTGETYQTGTEGKYFAFKYLPGGTYRIYQISKNNKPLIKPVDMALNFTVRPLTIKILPRIHIYQGVRVITTHPPIVKYQVSHIPYPKAELDQYLEEILSSGDKRGFRVVQ